MPDQHRSAKVTSLSPIQALHGELRDASPTLVGNADLLRSVLAGCGDCIKVLDLEGRLIFMSEGGKRVMEVEDFSVLGRRREPASGGCRRKRQRGQDRAFPGARQHRKRQPALLGRSGFAHQWR
jgi:hypothetical protein